MERLKCTLIGRGWTDMQFGELIDFRARFERKMYVMQYKLRCGNMYKRLSHDRASTSIREKGCGQRNRSSVSLINFIKAVLTETVDMSGTPPEWSRAKANPEVCN